MTEICPKDVDLEEETTSSGRIIAAANLVNLVSSFPHCINRSNFLFSLSIFFFHLFFAFSLRQSALELSASQEHFAMWDILSELDVSSYLQVIPFTENYFPSKNLLSFVAHSKRANRGCKNEDWFRKFR